MTGAGRWLGRALLLALLATAAAEARGEVARPLDLWPFVVRDARSVAGVRATRVAGPFFESWERSDGETGWTLRPLLARRQMGERNEIEFLYPLGSLRRDDSGHRLRLTPFYDRSERNDNAGEENPARRKGWSFLTLFGGTTDDGDRYLGLFPLGGVILERFGLERLDFWLFPLFARARYPSGFQRTWLLWPFLSWGSGGERELLKVWPIFGRDVREGEFERRYAAWPFLHWRRERIGSGAEHRVRLLLPLYGDRRAAHTRSRFVLGPLYLHAEDDRNGATSTDLLWPLVRWARRPGPDGGVGARELRIEPLFQRRTTPGTTRTQLLVGSIDWFSARRDTLRHSGLRLLFVNRFERLQDETLGLTRVRRQVFPLFRYGEDREGGVVSAGRLTFPWLLPLGGEGWNRHLLGLTLLYEGRWQEDETRSDWLWGLARRRVGRDYRLDALSWVARREREGEAPARWQLLGAPLP